MTHFQLQTIEMTLNMNVLRKFPFFLGGGNSNKISLSSLFREMIQFDEHIFETG